MIRTFMSSVTRISDLTQDNFDTSRLARDHWATGDYVVGKVQDISGHLTAIEMPNGRMIDVMEDDLVIGAFGTRVATLEAVGDWRSIDESGHFNALTSAGLFGKTTSLSPFLSSPMRLVYQGHVTRNDAKVTMSGSLPEIEIVDFDIPVILIVGTSMSAGKTMSGRVIVHMLSQMGLNVVGAKLTGAARYRDMLSFGDAGASAIYDFVDAGLPSTVVPEEEFRAAIRPLLSHIARRDADFMVVEAGASPLEPYNGAAAIEELGASVRCCVLCATDPYAVVGVQKAYGLMPDLVAGPATNTSAALDLVEKLTGLPGINIIDPDQLPVFRDFLVHILRIDAETRRVPGSA